jgi:hypothetical protein
MRSGGSTAERREKLLAMSFRLSFHQAILDLSGAHWPDDPPDLSCQYGTRQYALDDARLSCKLQVGGSSPPPAPKTAAQRLALLALLGLIGAADLSRR